MVELSEDLKKDLKKLADANRRKQATSEDLATIIHPYLPAEAQIQEESIFMRKARMVLKSPEPEPIETPTPEPIQTKQPQLSALAKVVVWFTTKLEALSQRLEQGHGSGVNADKLDDLEAEELMVRAANMAQRGRGGGTLTTDHGNLQGLDHDDHIQYYNATRHTKALHTTLGLFATDGSEAMTDDLDFGTYDARKVDRLYFMGRNLVSECILLRESQSVGTTTLLVRNAADTANADILVDRLNTRYFTWTSAAHYMETGLGQFFHTAGTAPLTCIHVDGSVGANPMCNIPRAGNIIVLTGKTITVTDLGGAGDRYVYVDNNGVLKQGAAYP